MIPKVLTQEAPEGPTDRISASQEPELELDEVCPALFREWACGRPKGHLGPCEDAGPDWFRAWRRSVERQRALRRDSDT